MDAWVSDFQYPCVSERGTVKPLAQVSGLGPHADPECVLDDRFRLILDRRMEGTGYCGW